MGAGTFDIDFGMFAVAAGVLTSATDDLDGEISALCDSLRRCSPQGLRDAKRVANRDVVTEFDERAEQMQQLSAALFASDEAREGMLAFLEKRPPRWVAEAP